MGGSGFCKSACFNCNFSSVLQLVFPNRKVLHLFVCRGKFYQISHWFAYVDVGQLAKAEWESKASSLPVLEQEQELEQAPRALDKHFSASETSLRGAKGSRTLRLPTAAQRKWLPAASIPLDGPDSPSSLCRCVLCWHKERQQKCSSWSHLGYPGGARQGHARTPALRSSTRQSVWNFINILLLFLPALLGDAECFLKFIKFVESGPFKVRRGE